MYNCFYNIIKTGVRLWAEEHIGVIIDLILKLGLCLEDRNEAESNAFLRITLTYASNEK